MPIADSFWSGAPISLLANVVGGSEFQVDGGARAHRRRGHVHLADPLRPTPGPNGLLMNDKVRSLHWIPTPQEGLKRYAILWREPKTDAGQSSQAEGNLTALGCL